LAKIGVERFWEFDHTGVVICGRIAALWSYGYDEAGSFRIFRGGRILHRTGIVSGGFRLDFHTPIVRADFSRLYGFWPNWRRKRTPPCGCFTCPPSLVLRRDGAGDAAHGVVEGQAQDLDIEVSGVTGQIALGQRQ